MNRLPPLEDEMKKRIILFTALALCAILPFTACSGFAEETPAPGYYAGIEGALELFEDGTALFHAPGSTWLIRWDDRFIYSETDTPGAYTFRDGHLSFQWEGGDGLYTYEFDLVPGNRLPSIAEPELMPGGVSGYFDVTDEEPFFLHRDYGCNYGYEMDFWQGCSVWCSVLDYTVSVTASSFLAPQGKYSYEPGNIIDPNRACAWVEGVPGYGTGEYVEITRNYTVGDEEYGVDYRGLCIVNGYARTLDTWKNNSRVEFLRMYVNGEYIGTLHLADTMEPQYFDLTSLSLHAASGEDTVFRFEIASVYPGEKYDDTVITGIETEFWTPNH